MRRALARINRRYRGRIQLAIPAAVAVGWFAFAALTATAHDTITEPTTATQTCATTHYAVGVPCFVAP